MIARCSGYDDVLDHSKKWEGIRGQEMQGARGRYDDQECGSRMGFDRKLGKPRSRSGHTAVMENEVGVHEARGSMAAQETGNKNVRPSENSTKKHPTHVSRCLINLHPPTTPLCCHHARHS